MVDHGDRQSPKAPFGKAKRQVAVALRHERGEIPTVVSSGRGHTAERILELAFAAGVKVRQDRDLAELLAAIEVDCPIPISCFEAVAEILNYLYRANAATAASPE